MVTNNDGLLSVVNKPKNNARINNGVVVKRSGKKTCRVVYNKHQRVPTLNVIQYNYYFNYLQRKEVFYE